MTQQYSTPDGSIWEVSPHGPAGGVEFIRVDSSDDSHEDDFRAQSLSEVLRYWGPLSLHDADEEERKLLVAVLLGLPWSQDSHKYAATLQKEFRRMGLRLIRWERKE